MTAPEFSRLARLETIGDDRRRIDLTATSDERGALARRFDLVALDRLEAWAEVRREAGGIRAEGRLSADVVQACVMTGDPVPTTLDESFALRFVAQASNAAEEVELSEEDLDTLPFDGQAVDLGEAVAETLGLALDPYPRRADAPAPGETGDPEPPHPFAALQALKDKLGE